MLTIGTIHDTHRPATLPTSAITQKIAMLARTGGGKTYAAMKLAEQMLENNFTIVAIDPIGVWWGLRASGDRPGFPVLLLGGEDSARRDMELRPDSGKAVAEWIVHERVSTILDMSAFGENEMRRFVADFTSTLYRRNRNALHVFIDEADEFAPQSATGGIAAACLGAMQNLVRRGRARGIGCTLITQRSAALHKGVLTQTEALFMFQTTGPHDLKALDDWIKFHGTPDEREQIMRSLTKLKRGQCWLYSPAWLQTLERVDIGKRGTFDSSRTPEHGEALKPPKSLADIDLARLSDRFAEQMKHQKANDPAELKNRVAELEAELRKANAAQRNPDAAIIAAAKEQAAAETRYQLRGRMTGVRETLGWVSSQLEDCVRKIGTVSAAVDIGEKPPATPNVAAATRNVAPLGRTDITPPSRPAASNNGLDYGSRVVLTAIAQQGQLGASREQLTVLTGYKRSSRDAYIQRLRAAGRVEQNGDSLVATETGIRDLGPEYAPLPTGGELREYWLAKLSGGERSIFQIAIDTYPSEVSRSEISTRTKYQRSSRDAYIQRLISRRLVIRTGGGICAAKELFQ